MSYTALNNVINFSRQSTSYSKKASTQPSSSQAIARQRPRQNRQDLMIALAVEQGTVVMQLMGKLNIATIPVFTGFLQTFADDGYISFIFDLTDLSSIDNAGIIALTQANHQLKDLGGQATIINSNEKLYRELSRNNLTLR